MFLQGLLHCWVQIYLTHHLIMTTKTLNTQQNVVKDLRKIRDQISNEIKDMSFEQERAYFDKLLADKKKSAPKSMILALCNYLLNKSAIYSRI